MGLTTAPERDIKKLKKDQLAVPEQDLLDGLESLRKELNDATALGDLQRHPGFQVLTNILSDRREQVMRDLVAVDATMQSKVIHLQAEVKALNFYLNIVPLAARAAGNMEVNLRQKLEERRERPEE